jgi:hypothetical protein
MGMCCHLVAKVGSNNISFLLEPLLIRVSKPRQKYLFYRHGGWWATKDCRHISGPVSIEIGDNCYVRALDDGTFTVGAPHGDGKPFIQDYMENTNLL